MFNEETKKLFIKSLSTNDLKNMYSSIFKRTASFEAVKDSDIYIYNPDECVKLLINLNPKSIGHIASLKSQLSKYADWATKKGFSERNYWSIVAIDEDIVKSSFITRNAKDLDSLKTIVDSGLSVPYDKYVVYLLYMGIMGENFSELTQVKDSDIDKSNKSIKTSRRIYTALTELLFNAINSGEYYEEKKQRDYKSIYFIKPYKTKNLIGEPISYQHVHRVIQKMNDTFNAQNPDNQKLFTPTTIWRSGLFYSMYKIELLKGVLMQDDFECISEIYGNKVAFSSYLRDYELYKEIFW
jgi:hypothetical protein